MSIDQAIKGLYVILAAICLLTFWFGGQPWGIAAIVISLLIVGCINAGVWWVEQIVERKWYTW